MCEAERPAIRELCYALVRVLMEETSQSHEDIAGELLGCIALVFFTHARECCGLDQATTESLASDLIDELREVLRKCEEKASFLG